MTISAAVPIGTASVHSGYVSAPTSQGRMYINARNRADGYTDYTFTKVPLADRQAAVAAFIDAHGGEDHPKKRADGTIIEHRVRVLHA